MHKQRIEEFARSVLVVLKCNFVVLQHRKPERAEQVRALVSTGEMALANDTATSSTNTAAWLSMMFPIRHNGLGDAIAWSALVEAHLIRDADRLTEISNAYRAESHLESTPQPA